MIQAIPYQPADRVRYLTAIPGLVTYVTPKAGLSGSSTFGIDANGFLRGITPISGSVTFGLSLSGSLNQPITTIRTVWGLPIVWPQLASVNPWRGRVGIHHSRFSPQGALSGSTSFGFTPTGTMMGTGALGGDISLGFELSGALSGIGGNVLSGETTFGFVPTGTLTGKGALSGTATVGLSTAGTMMARNPVSGSLSFGFSVSGALTPQGRISGSTSFGLSATGTLTSPTPAIAESAPRRRTLDARQKTTDARVSGKQKPKRVMTRLPKSAK